jgi:hypothetical protein
VKGVLVHLELGGLGCIVGTCLCLPRIACVRVWGECVGGSCFHDLLCVGVGLVQLTEGVDDDRQPHDDAHWACHRAAKFKLGHGLGVASVGCAVLRGAVQLLCRPQVATCVIPKLKLLGCDQALGQHATVIFLPLHAECCTCEELCIWCERGSQEVADDSEVGGQGKRRVFQGGRSRFLQKQGRRKFQICF